MVECQFFGHFVTDVVQPHPISYHQNKCYE